MRILFVGSETYKDLENPLLDHPEPTLEASSAFADAFYSSVQLVAEYMERSMPMIQGVFPKVETPDRDAALQGLWMRGLAWMLSLKVLNHTKHFQAIAAGNRALLEIAVDLVLLHSDPTNDAGLKMRWWALSEKLMAAESTIRFFKEGGQNLPSEHEVLRQFIENEQGIVEAQRQRLWKTQKHPRRWTGKSDLSKDVEQADDVMPARFASDLTSSLTEYYRTEYRRMNWQIHSGVAAVTALPPMVYNLMAARSLQWCADLGMLSTQIVLTDYGFGDAFPDLGEQWRNLRRARLEAYAEKMRPHAKSGKP